MKIAIVGMGVVGSNMFKIFPEALPIDTNRPGDCHPVTPQWVDLAFVCVPTPMLPDGSCDTSIVETAIRENRAGVFCVKSTVPPGTIDRMCADTGENIIFSPEFFGATQHANAVDYDFVILGGNRHAADVVAEAYKGKMPGSYRIIKTDAKTAEFVKLAENSFLAMKVTFFNSLYRIAEKIEIDIDEMRELLLNDPRIGRSHTFVYRDHPFYQSHCLDKDIPSFIEYAKSVGSRFELMESVKKINDEWRNENGKTAK